MALQDTLDQINNLDLNDIDWSKMGVWPLAGRLTIWGLAMLAVVLIVYFFFVQNLHQTLAREIKKEEDKRKTFQSKVFQAATLDQHRELMKMMQKDFKVLVAQLPKKTQVPGLLDDIDEKGRDSGLTIVSIKLKPEVVDEFYVVLPIEIVVTGSYHDLGAFVSGIAGMSRIVTLHDFKINSSKGAANLSMTIQAKTYRSRDEEDGK